MSASCADEGVGVAETGYFVMSALTTALVSLYRGDSSERRRGSPLREPGSGSHEIPRGAGSTRECGFREGATVSGDTCLIGEKLDVPAGARHWRRRRWFRSREYRRLGIATFNERRSVVASTPLGMRGSIHQRRTVVSSSGILYRCPSFPAPYPLGPFLSSFSVLHPSFLLSLNSRRATACIPRYVPSRQPPRLFRALLPSIFETAHRDTWPVSSSP